MLPFYGSLYKFIRHFHSCLCFAVKICIWWWCQNVQDIEPLTFKFCTAVVVPFLPQCIFFFLLSLLIQMYLLFLNLSLGCGTVLMCTWFDEQDFNCCPSVCLRSHARLRCMCACNRCTFCICQNFLNSDLLQSVKNKLFTAVLNRSLTLFTRYQVCF